MVKRARKCNFCSKPYKSEKTLQNHIDKEHAGKHDDVCQTEHSSSVASAVLSVEHAPGATAELPVPTASVVTLASIADPMNQHTPQPPQTPCPTLRRPIPRGWSLKQNSQPSSYQHMTPVPPGKEWKKMKTYPMRMMMENLGLNDRGKRPELVERLQGHYATNPSMSGCLDAGYAEYAEPQEMPPAAVTMDMIWHSLSVLTQSVYNLNKRFNILGEEDVTSELDVSPDVDTISSSSTFSEKRKLSISTTQIDSEEEEQTCSTTDHHMEANAEWTVQTRNHAATLVAFENQQPVKLGNFYEPITEMTSMDADHPRPNPHNSWSPEPHREDHHCPNPRKDDQQSDLRRDFHREPSRRDGRSEPSREDCPQELSREDTYYESRRDDHCHVPSREDRHPEPRRDDQHHGWRRDDHKPELRRHDHHHTPSKEVSRSGSRQDEQRPELRRVEHHAEPRSNSHRREQPSEDYHPRRQQDEQCFETGRGKHCPEASTDSGQRTDGHAEKRARPDRGLAGHLEHTGQNRNLQRRGPPCPPPLHESFIMQQRQQQPTRAEPQAQPSQKSKTLILSDSICRNIKNKNVNSLVDRNREEVIVSHHPGAITKQLHHYMGYWVKEDKPDRIIIVAGANDMLQESWKARQRRQQVSTEHTIVSKVLDMGEEAQKAGIRHICISGLYNVNNVCPNNTIIYNQLLEMGCANMGFRYISQSDIGTGDLFDGLHVNNTSGHSKLKHNLLSCLDTYDYYMNGNRNY